MMVLCLVEVRCLDVALCSVVVLNFSSSSLFASRSGEAVLALLEIALQKISDYQCHTVVLALYSHTCSTIAHRRPGSDACMYDAPMCVRIEVCSAPSRVLWWRRWGWGPKGHCALFGECCRAWL